MLNSTSGNLQIRFCPFRVLKDLSSFTKFTLDIKQTSSLLKILNLTKSFTNSPSVQSSTPPCVCWTPRNDLPVLLWEPVTSFTVDDFGLVPFPGLSSGDLTPRITRSSIPILKRRTEVVINRDTGSVDLKDLKSSPTYRHPVS